ncbi:exosome complex component RRP42-like [Centruroides sculpturatus]|uniref:exosome complex component RRP42-like n=1 Tax=Centruroides sculpturatus TaxID=218467 RepID=UPI000C6E71A6|nr:exosome complex component RRP42-like [Centruroides sculpturatus]
MAVSLSESEKTYIIQNIQDDLRSDGRSCLDYRFIEIETDVISSCNGSSHVRLANSDILVGVKVELDEPDPAKPNEGRIKIFVDCSANADPEFEGRGGEDIADDIGMILGQAYSSPQCLDLKSLCVIPGQQVWILYVDIVILQCGGSLLDAASMAVKAALFNTKIPSLVINYETEGKAEIDVTEDPFDVKSLDTSNIPCLVTLCRVGHQFIVDATQEEEECCVAKLVMAVSESGTLTAVRKCGPGSLHPESILDILETGKEIGIMLNEKELEKKHVLCSCCL